MMRSGWLRFSSRAKGTAWPRCGPSLTVIASTRPPHARTRRSSASGGYGSTLPSTITSSCRPPMRAAASGNPGAVRNAGLKGAQGELITFLDSDDVWRPTALAELAAALDDHPEAGFAYCDYAPPLLHPPSLPVAGDIFNQLLGLDFIVTSGVLVRRSVAETVGVFDPRCSPAEDWDYWLRMAARFLPVHVPHELVAIAAP